MIGEGLIYKILLVLILLKWMILLNGVFENIMELIDFDVKLELLFFKDVGRC